jgi:hypothetical protein
MSQLPKPNNLVNIFTYSTRPYIKYLFYLRFILLFFSKQFIETYQKLTSNDDKFNHFFTINVLIQNKLDTNCRFADLVKNIFYESIVDIKSSLDKFFYFFKFLSNYLDEIFDKLNNPLFKNNFAYTGADINLIKLSDDSNITNSIITYLEQSSPMTTNSYLDFKINNFEVLSDRYNKTFDVNKSIRDLNNEIRTDLFVDNLMTKDIYNMGGLLTLNNFLNNNLLKEIIRMSFFEQKDILFVPIEPNDVKRERMRNIRLIDLL